MFWGNSPHSPVIFKMQKRVIKILMGSGYRESCRGLFKELKILTLASQYIFSLLLFVVLDRGYCAPNSVYHNFNTRHKNDLHLPHASLTVCQRGAFFLSNDVRKFKLALKRFLLEGSFYTIQEYFDWESIINKLC
jgi:hypothetical protein